MTQDEQCTRFAIRQIDPVQRWKLSPMDLENLDRWEAYTAAKEAMFERTDKKYAPFWPGPLRGQGPRRRLRP